MRKHLFAERNGRWCAAEVSIEDGRLSITGSEGRIVTAASARKEAREYWEGFFEECPEELAEMRRKYGKSTPKSAARYVIEVDGEYHGLDVHREDGNRVYLLESCGQIQEDLRAWFPQLAPLLPWHLNDMHAECTHQEARGETYRTHPGAECGECGYKLGSAWMRRELPAEVLAAVGAL